MNICRVLDASLSASASPDCSLKMAVMLTQVCFWIMLITCSFFFFLT